MGRPDALRTSVFLIGFTSVCAQILLLRELMVVFNGNEMTLGLMLAVWLLWTAAGSALLGRVPLRFLQCAVALGLPLAIAAVRGSRSLFRSLPGEVLGPLPMLITATLALGLFCAVSGGVFAAASRLRSGAWVYLVEAAGSAAGGLLASLILIRHVNPFEIALGLTAGNLACAAGRFAPAALALLLAVPYAGQRLESRSLEWLWQGFPLVASRNSVYGNLVLTGDEGSQTLYQNGLRVATVPDPEAAEEAVHFALLEHPAPRRVLLIGGGFNGGVAEALKHPTLERLDYVELDAAMLGMLPGVPRDRRVHVHLTDARLFLKRSAETFDAVIINLPDPQTAQLNRFYTLEFFREARLRLDKGGVMALRLSGAENYISPELARFLGSIRVTLRAVFPNLAAIPGGAVHFFASDAPLVTTAEGLLARLRERGIKTQYIREYYLSFRMAPDRLREFEERTRPGTGMRVNRDFAPIAYYFSVTLWSAPFGGADFLERLMVLDFKVLAAAAAIAGLLLGGVRRALSGTAATGFTVMGLEVMLLLGFQARHGYVYHELASLTAGFMAGAAVGTWAGMRYARLSLKTLQAAAALGPLLLVPLLMVVHAAVFPLLAVICGALGGYQFATASRLTPKAGLLYAVDLAGACAAALLLNGWLIPVYGFSKTAGLMAIGSAAAWIRRTRDW